MTMLSPPIHFLTLALYKFIYLLTYLSSYLITCFQTTICDSQTPGWIQGKGPRKTVERKGTGRERKKKRGEWDGNVKGNGWVVRGSELGLGFFKPPNLNFMQATSLFV